MKIELQVQRTVAGNGIPLDADFLRWVRASLRGRGDSILTIRIVDRAESAELNGRYRAKKGPTNVLSFPADLPAEADFPLLGDIVICAPLVAEEAREQGKEPQAHWAHLVVHGVLHLLGFDHRHEEEALRMESREQRLLASLGYPDPYA
jgi:probable rRNA maturation factor